MVAFEQIWMMTELSLRIRQSESLEKRIRLGRIVVLLIDALFFTSIIGVCIYFLAAVETEEDRLQYSKNTGLFFAILFGVLFFALAFSVMFLIRLLWLRNKQV